MNKLLRISEVSNVVGLSKSALYDKIRKGVFPQGIKIGLRARAWKESELQEWIDSCSKDVEGVYND